MKAFRGEILSVPEDPAAGGAEGVRHYEDGLLVVEDGLVLACGLFAALVLFERRRPLRRRVEPKLRRNLRNLSVAGLGGAAQLAAAPLLRPLTAEVERRRWGLVPRLGLPRPGAR